MEKEFYEKNVLFNNGIVNFYEYLNSKDDAQVHCCMDKNKITLESNIEENILCQEILADFIDENSIVHFTNNDREYWDEDNSCFVMDKKIDIKGKGSPNDIKYGVYYKTNVAQLGMSTQQVYELFKDFCQKNKFKNKETEKSFFEKGSSKLKESDKAEIILYKTLTDSTKKFAVYLLKGDNLTLDSKIHQFEDGGFCFKDYLTKKKESINKWDALIYWFGSKTKRFYNNKHYIYINSSNLKALYVFKNALKISENDTTVRDEKTGKLSTIRTNIDIFQQLNMDGIKNKNFYISKSRQEFKLKFLMCVFSFIYHIEDNYENKLDERRRVRKKDLYDSLREISFVSYSDNESNMKTSFEEYTKAYHLFELFELLIKAKFKNDEKGQLFQYLSTVITVIATAKENKIENINIRKTAENILNFRNLRKNYLEASFDTLKYEKSGFGKNLYEFEKVYLKFIGGEEMELNLHDRSKKLGDEIGYFTASTEDENLLYKLRSIKNHKQLVSYFKDLKFKTLKNSEEARFTNEFNVQLDEILSLLEKDSGNWELVRDYIAIYSIDKYKSTLFAKMKNRGGK